MTEALFEAAYTIPVSKKGLPMGEVKYKTSRAKTQHCAECVQLQVETGGKWGPRKAVRWVREVGGVSHFICGPHASVYQDLENR